MGTESKMGYSEMHVGGIDVGSMVTSSTPGFRGSLQQLTFNGEKLFELANTGQLTTIQHTVRFCRENDTLFRFWGPDCIILQDVVSS